MVQQSIRVSIRCVVVLSAALLMSTGVFAAMAGMGSARGSDKVTGQGDVDALLKKFMDLSGLERMIEQLPMLMQMGADQGWQNDRQGSGNKRAATAEDFARFKSALADAFAPNVFTRDIHGRLAAGLDAGTLAAVIAELEKPLQRKISAIEIANTTPEKIVEVQKYAATLAQNPPEAGRAALVRRLVKATRAAEMQAEMMVRMRLVFARLALVAMPEPGRSEAERGLASVAAQIRADSLPQAAEENYATALCIYRTLSDGELNEYLRFHESELGHKTVEAVNRAFVESMEAATLSLSQKMMETAPSRAK